MCTCTSGPCVAIIHSILLPLLYSLLSKFPESVLNNCLTLFGLDLQTSAIQVVTRKLP